MRWERARTLSLDYTTGPGTHEGNYLHIVRPQITFTTLTDDSTSVGRSAFGGMMLAGTYKGRRWIQGDRLDSVLRNLSAFGLAGYYDGNIGLAGKALALGVGWTCMAALEGGNYYSVWHHGSGWPWFLLPQAGVYLFLDADISSSSGFWVRGGFAMPGPVYLDGGISWKEFNASFGASRIEEETRFTAGLHYRLP